MSTKHKWITGPDAWQGSVHEHPELGRGLGKRTFHNGLRRYRDPLVAADVIRLVKGRVCAGALSGRRCTTAARLVVGQRTFLRKALLQAALLEHLRAHVFVVVTAISSCARRAGLRAVDARYADSIESRAQKFGDVLNFHEHQFH